MNNVFLQIETRVEKYREQVLDATDLRPTLHNLWKAIQGIPSRCYIDLVDERGRPLASDEREAFFASADADCEMAIGDCYVASTIEFSEPLTDDQLRAVVGYIDDLPHSGVKARADAYEVELSSSEDIHFTAFPNRNTRLKSARYEHVESEASYASWHSAKAVNDALKALVDIIEDGLGVDMHVIAFHPDFFDFRGDCPMYGDYRVVNLADLEYGYI